jgi:ketosteroid isomerase-like protein
VTPVEAYIRSLVDLETRGWDTRDPDLFLSIIHPDMAWPWPPGPGAHDPVDWVFVLGRFDRARWRRNWQDLFDSHELVRNRRETVKVTVSAEGDAAFAVVDIDTLWRHKVTGQDFPWKGRTCKVYTRLRSGEWKMILQTGALEYPPGRG